MLLPCIPWRVFNVETLQIKHSEELEQNNCQREENNFLVLWRFILRDLNKSSSQLFFLKNLADIRRIDSDLNKENEEGENDF